VAAGFIAPVQAQHEILDSVRKLDVLTPKTQYSLANAKTYFEEHLSVGDYYTEGENISGQWFGQGASMLGLAGDVKQDAFLRLCDNLHPRTGELLTQRRKTTRRAADESGNEQEVANRRVFYDFTISPPKSVSVLALIGGDERIVDAHNRAVKTAMNELERFAETRVRSRGECSDRPTGNVVAAAFRHDTSRALDPHLHSHCILFNATFDPVEKRWKALQNHEMLLARKYVENVYYHELTRELRCFGYEIENHVRGDFEIRGVSKKLCERFSKRHAEIDEKTRDLLAREPAKATGNVDDIRANIARDERSRKIKNVAMDQLQTLWSSQMSDGERSEIAALIAGVTVNHNGQGFGIAQAAIAWAEDHLFDRKSVVHEHEIWRHALEHARGENLSIAEVHAATGRADYVRDAEIQWRITMREVLQREWKIVEMARNGVGTLDALNAHHGAGDPSLDQEQRDAVGRILRSRDFVTLFRGGAGTGKSYALREVDSSLRQQGRAVRVIAPQRQQVMDLTRDGFDGAQTVSEFLTRLKMEPGEVVVVDEAGQLGAKQMLHLLEFVRENGGRVILSGDTRQHGAVEASDALRAIEMYSGLAAAELTEIRRQDPAKANSPAERKFIEEYKKAVEDAAAGDIAESFERLERNGAVVECGIGEQQERLTAHYLELARSGQSTVVVAQTWSEIHKVNDAVRQALKAEGLIGKEEQAVSTLERIDLTDAQKRDSRFYDADTVLVLNRDAGGFQKGQIARFLGISQKGVIVETDQKVGSIATKHLSCLTACRRKELALASGDRLQLKANAVASDGRRLANGELVTVHAVHANGEIALADGRVLPRDYRQFVGGFAVTSYASQGKTVDYVLFSDSAVKAATNAQQWYVSISRGRKGVRIFTSDKGQLCENVSRSGNRALALDLVQLGRLPRQALRQHRFHGLTRLRQFAVALRARAASLIASRKVTPMRQKIATND
jgi:conjugative relaxase-like TrwC/TraI family protein